MTEVSADAAPRPRGRPKTRISGRSEQVAQNMRLYRTRRAAELDALGKALAALEKAVAAGDGDRLLRAAASVCGIWSGGRLKESVSRARQQRMAKQASG